MQPYVFPYLGYFQLVAAVDRFVFFDDVAFIKRGWIHRNRILVQGAPHTFTIPVADASQNRPINETAIHAEAFVPSKLLRTLELAYRRAPHFAATFALAESVFTAGHKTIAEMAKHSVRAVAEFLGMPTQFVETSASYGNRELKGQERIVDICRQENAALYVNAAGGAELYDAAAFALIGTELRFLKSHAVTYPQFGGAFAPSLSMLDVLMFNSREAAAELLRACELIRPAEVAAS